MGTPDAITARLGTANHGVVKRAQLLAAGMTPRQIGRRLRSGALIREHPGVYRVGHRAPSLEASYLAAVWACGDGAILCGRAAAHLFGLVKGAAPPPEVATINRRRIPGIRTRRLRIDPLDATRWRQIPVTTVPRTLVDIAGDLPLDALTRGCHEAEVVYRVTPAAVEAALARYPNAKGAGRLRAILRGDTHISLSALEKRFLELLEDAGLPLPQTNRPHDGHHVDCRWPDRKLTVELDSYRYHHSRHAFEQDRLREREARARGDDFRRFTYGDVYERPRLTVSELRPVLQPGEAPTRACA